MTDGLLTGVCSLDIKKCFDTINHKILLKKLSYYGFNDNVVEWFKAYLQNRTQVVKCHNVVSREMNIEVGIPQGSVMGPILFLIYINDINMHIHLGTCNLFADDNITYKAGSTKIDTQNGLQQSVDSVDSWYNHNKQVVNAVKSYTMLMSTSQKESKDISTDNENLNIRLGTEDLKCVDSVPYLGVIIDKNLSWNEKVNQLSKKLASRVAMLSRLKNVLPDHALKSIYNAIVQPYIDYAITVWGFTSQTNID